MADKKKNNMQEISDADYEKMVYQDGESLVVDLSAVEEMKFELIPKGIYKAEVDQCDYVPQSQNSGSPMFEFTFRITDGEFANRKLRYWTSFSPKALQGTKTSLLRLDPDMFTGVFKPQEIAESGQLLNKQVRIKVDHQDYQGSDRPKISYLLPLQEGAEGGKGFFKGQGAAATAAA